MFEKFLRYFEETGKKRAAAELRRLGYIKEAKDLLK